MDPVTQWMLGIIMAGIGVVGGFIVRDRQILQIIREGDDKANDRINTVRDEYVRRDDFERQVTRIEKSIDDVHTEMRELNRNNEQFAANFQNIVVMMQSMSQLLVQIQQATVQHKN